MRTLALTIFIICACTSVHAQINLIYNGSFEQHDSCPDNFDQIRTAKHWDAIDTNYVWGDSAFYSLTEQYPEYINICGTGAGSAPRNGYFYQYPRTGNGMVQSAMFNDYFYAHTGYDFFNYTQGRLSTHLLAGKSYCVTFYLVKEEASQYSIDKIGAYLDDGTIDTTRTPAKLQSQYTPQIVGTSVIYDTLHWTKIEGNFVANGTEKFITIGMFFDTGYVTHIEDASSTSHYGMYLIDDVSVIATDAIAYAGRDTVIHHGDTAKIGPSINGDGMPCWWYKLGSSTPIDSGGNTSVHPDTSTSYVVKMDICGHITYDTVRVRVWPDTVTSVVNYQLSIVNCRVYPNPAMDELTVEVDPSFAGALAGDAREVIIYDVVGRVVKREQLNFGSKVAQLSLAGISPGTYTLSLRDGYNRQINLSFVKE